MTRGKNAFYDKFNYLLVAEILALLSYPIFSTIQTRFPITMCILLLALVPALNIALPRTKFIYAAALGFLALLTNIFLSYSFIPDKKMIVIILLILYALFFIVSIVSLLRNLMLTDRVTSDTIKGGIGIYFLIAFLWTVFYYITFITHPDAFNISQIHGIDLIYFSFITMTTVGFGDFLPTSVWTKTLAITQAFTGQIYLAIFIAQLVGMNIAGKISRKTPN